MREGKLSLQSGKRIMDTKGESMVFEVAYLLSEYRPWSFTCQVPEFFGTQDIIDLLLKEHADLDPLFDNLLLTLK